MSLKPPLALGQREKRRYSIFPRFRTRGEILEKKKEKGNAAEKGEKCRGEVKEKIGPTQITKEGK